MVKKIILLAFVALFLIANLNFAYPRHIVWTEYSDITSTDFNIMNPAQPPTPEPEEHEQKPCKPFEIPKQKEIKYGEWKCINNKMQRTNIKNGAEQIEFGGLCGLELEAKDKIKIRLFWILPILFILLNIFLLLAIAGIIIRKI